jgi:hypothetical protein
MGEMLLRKALETIEVIFKEHFVMDKYSTGLMQFPFPKRRCNARAVGIITHRTLKKGKGGVLLECWLND